LAFLTESYADVNSFEKKSDRHYSSAFIW
jgi:hypothetical protein